MTSQLLEQILHTYDFRPTAGRCIVRMERKSTKPGGPDSVIIAPEVARDVKPRDIAFFGTVVKMTPRSKDFVEDFKEGDRVWCMLLWCDLEEEYILTENTRVYARERREGE